MKGCISVRSQVDIRNDNVSIFIILWVYTQHLRIDKEFQQLIFFVECCIGNEGLEFEITRAAELAVNKRGTGEREPPA